MTEGRTNFVQKYKLSHFCCIFLIFQSARINTSGRREKNKRDIHTHPQPGLDRSKICPYGSLPTQLILSFCDFPSWGWWEKTPTEHKDRSTLVQHFHLSLLQPLFLSSPTPMAQFTLLSPLWHLCYQLRLTSQALILDRVSLRVIPETSDLSENYRNTIRRSKPALTQLWTHFGPSYK